MTIKGYWMDGQTSATIEAGLIIELGGTARVVRLDNGHELARGQRNSLDISPRLGKTPRFVRFTNGGKFETHDNDGIDDRLFRLGQKPKLSLVRALESRWSYVVVCLLTFALICWGAVSYGLPLAAKGIAGMLPAGLYDYADEHAMEFFDKVLVDNTQLTYERQKSLREHFAPVLKNHPDLNLRVLFRKGTRVGPNAFALPGGTLVFTDEMVNLAEHDDELLSVLAHEIGHVKNQHAMRRLVQSSLLTFLLLAVTGDVGGTSELFLGIPVFLTEMHYSREFEREADAYALKYLKQHNIPTKRFADLMRRVMAKVRGKSKGKEDKVISYLSTHPSMQERLIPFEKKAAQPGK
jgi:Zn-dependent protease with chaperone function